MILGSDLPTFLSYLDKYLCENNRRGKMWLGVSIGTMGVFFVISKFVFPEHFSRKKK